MGKITTFQFLKICALGIAWTMGIAQAGDLPWQNMPLGYDLTDLSNLGLMTLHHDGKPRDPVNLVLVGEKEEVLKAMVQAGWVLAKPHTFRRVIQEAACILEHRSDPAAPISHSYLFNRREDLAFEFQVGGSPKRRHHIRLWEAPFLLRGVPVWMGAATFDRGIKIFKFDHKVEKKVDGERDYLLEALRGAGVISRARYIPGFDSLQLKQICGFESDGNVALADLEPAAGNYKKNAIR